MNQARTDGGVTPLYMACEEGQGEVVKLLLAQDGIDGNKAGTRLECNPTPPCML